MMYVDSMLREKHHHNAISPHKMKVTYESSPYKTQVNYEGEIS